mgnify:FL=1
MFQFLIGTLKTVAFFNSVYYSVTWFQFLIGTLKTQNKLLHAGTLKTVQFLIGTLKTCDYLPLGYLSFQVSIPDRYSKNWPLKCPTISPRFVSIPDRYSKNSSAPIRTM